MNQQTAGKTTLFGKSPVPASLLIIAAAGLIAYCNSFTGPFIFDDADSIPGNPYIRRLWPPQYLYSAPVNSTVAGRPIVSLTLALNYALCGYNVWGYHAVNLAIHIMAGLVLFGIVRRTLLTQRLKKRFGQHAFALACAVSVIWLVHPIQTESVTYIISRTESLMGLFYLLTLYAAIRAVPARAVFWSVLSVFFCALGMATKEAMVTAPIIVLAYDRTFCAGSLVAAVRRRWGLYLGLAGTWIILAGLMLTSPRTESVGFTLGAGPVDYAMNQCIMLIKYLHLVFWPARLVFDYGYPIAVPLSQVLPYALVLAGLLLAAVFVFFHRPVIGFPGIWFFIILAPTSSLVPVITEVGAERRMYLPLAALVALIVMGGYVLLDNIAKRFRRVNFAGPLGICLVVLTASVLGCRTFIRNRDYRTAESIWRASIKSLPDNSRAHFNLGEVLQSQGRLDEAIVCYRRTIWIAPDFIQAYSNLGVALQFKDRFDEAIRCFYEALKVAPDNPVVYYNLGVAFRSRGRFEQAVKSFQKVVELAPDDIDARRQLAITLKLQKKMTGR